MQVIKTAAKKKVVAGVIAGSVVLSSLGGTAFAYKDEWTAKINQGVAALAGYVFKDDIQKEVKAHGDAQEAGLKAWANDLISSMTKTFDEYKKSEIQRGKASIDEKVAQDKEQLQRAANNAVNAEKAKQQGKTTEAINKEKADLDGAIDGYLKQIPSGK